MTVYWRRSSQSKHWSYNARRPAGWPLTDLLCPSLPVEHRPSTTPHHSTLFWAALAIPDQLVPCCFSSASVSRLQLGWPLKYQFLNLWHDRTWEAPREKRGSVEPMSAALPPDILPLSYRGGRSWLLHITCHDNNNIIITAFKGAIRDFFTVSSLRRETSPTRTLKWPGTQSCANHVQNIERLLRATCRVTCHVVRVDRSAIKFDRV